MLISEKFAKRLILISGFVIAFLIFCYQLIEFALTGEWYWVVIGDIFTTWEDQVDPKDGRFQAFIYWFLTQLWIGILAIVYGVFSFFFAKPDHGDWSGGDGAD